MPGADEKEWNDLDGPRDFRTTHWSVVLTAGQADTTLAKNALERLCQTYWYPLYAYVRRRGYFEQDAKDLTQGFFEHLLQREAFHIVKPGRGKFRSFLLAALNHFLADEHKRQHAQKRGGGTVEFSIDGLEAEQRYRIEPEDGEAPDKLFDRRWALAVLDAAMVRLQKDFESAGKSLLLRQLTGFLVDGAERRPYAEVAVELGMTEEAVKKSVQRLRQRYREVIRQEIAHTVATTDEIEEELRQLVSILAT